MTAKEESTSSGSMFERLDVRALQAGLERYTPQTARVVRKNGVMPAPLRPDVTGLPKTEQITTVWGAYAIWSQRLAPADDDSAERERVQEIARIYADLRATGYLLDDVRALKERHGKAWLQGLRARGYAIGTIRSKWSVLRGWALALGKEGMIQSLEHYWADAPKVERALKGSGQQRRRELLADPRLEAELLRRQDRTHWFIEQLRQRLGLTPHEAVAFSPALAGDYARGVIAVRGRRDQVRSIPIATHEQRQIVQDVLGFIFSQQRKTLCWPKMSVGDGVRKHQQGLGYLLRKLQRHGDEGGQA